LYRPGAAAEIAPRVSLTEYLERAPEPASNDRVADPLLAGVLRRLIARLPERSRMIVILRFQEDLEPAEIAEMLSIPVGTVKVICIARWRCCAGNWSESERE